MIRIALTLHPAVWLTANQRLHWSTRMRRTRMLRSLAASEARITGAAGKRLGASTVTAMIGYPTQTRADPANAAPTVKAIIDGLVDARVWDDDDHTHPQRRLRTRPAESPQGHPHGVPHNSGTGDPQMKHYTRGQFTITFTLADGVAAAAVTAMLAQLKPGAVIDDVGVDVNGPFAGTRRLIINYREPAEKGD